MSATSQSVWAACHSSSRCPRQLLVPHTSEARAKLPAILRIISSRPYFPGGGSRDACSYLYERRDRKDSNGRKDACVVTTYGATEGLEEDRRLADWSLPIEAKVGCESVERQ